MWKVAAIGISLVSNVSTWFFMPSLNAYRFAQAVNDRQFDVAKGFMVNEQDLFSDELLQERLFEPKATIHPVWGLNDDGRLQQFICGTNLHVPTCSNLLNAEPSVAVHVVHSVHDHGIASHTVIFLSTRRGIERTMAFP